MTTQAQIERLEGEIKRLQSLCESFADDNECLIKQKLTAAAEVGPDMEANRLYRYLNGLDQDSHDKRAEHIMQQSLDGLTIGPGNRNSVKETLATHFEAVEAETIERCAQMVEEHDRHAWSTRPEALAAAIRALKDRP